MQSERDNTALLDALRLNLVSGVGPRLRHLLRNRFGSISAVFHASNGDLQSVPGVGSKLARAIRDGSELAAAERELARCRELNADLLLCDDERYPAALAEIPDAPDVLYCRGTLEPADAVAVSVAVAVRTVCRPAPIRSS
ncbi:MAG: helix-hairpin-helix domain-containing protein [Planctomycetaceae bacterium]